MLLFSFGNQREVENEGSNKRPWALASKEKTKIDMSKDDPQMQKSQSVYSIIILFHRLRVRVEIARFSLD
jgi:hypothetical protein